MILSHFIMHVICIANDFAVFIRLNKCARFFIEKIDNWSQMRIYVRNVKTLSSTKNRTLKGVTQRRCHEIFLPAKKILTKKSFIKREDRIMINTLFLKTYNIMIAHLSKNTQHVKTKQSFAQKIFTTDRRYKFISCICTIK